jgi:hypothetical protein
MVRKPLTRDADTEGLILTRQRVLVTGWMPVHARGVQHGRRGSSVYVLAASLQVWHGMMVLLGAARLDLDGMRPTLRDASTFSACGSCDSHNVRCCYIIHPLK